MRQGSSLACPTFKDTILNRVEKQTRDNRMKTLQPFALLEPAGMGAIMKNLREITYVGGGRE
jgi:hypothetical protein